MVKLSEKTNMIIFYSIYISILIILMNFDAINSNLMCIGWICNITLIVNIVYTTKLKKTWLNYNNIFMTFIFMFCCGQIFLYTLGINVSDELIFSSNSEAEIIRATTYFLFSFVLFSLGINMVSTSYDYSYRISKDYNEAIKKVAIFIFFTSGILYFYYNIPKLIQSISNGYSSLFIDNDSDSSNLLGYYSKFFVPSILLLIYTYRDNKKIRNILFIVLIIVALGLLLMGGRGGAISILVILIVFYGKFIKAYKKKDIIKLLIIFLLISILIPFMANYRDNRNNDIQEVFEDVLKNDNNPITQTIMELGGSMNAWCLTDKAIPTLQNYSYGGSYLASIGMLVPSFMLGGISVANYAALDIWLQNIWNMPYGPGFNIFAETYYNFGWIFGIIFAFFEGYLFGKLFNISSKNKDKNALFSVLSIIFLYNELLIARYPFHNTLRNFTYMFLIIYIIINTVYKYQDNKNSIK